MKIIFTCVTVFILFLGPLVQAQIKKGSVMLGGGISHASRKTDNESQSENNSRIKYFGIAPAAGIAINDNLLVGIELGYINRKTSYESIYSDVDQKSDGYFANATIRKYWNITSKFYAFAHGSAGYSSDKGRDKDNDIERHNNKRWTVNATLVPGIAYSVSRKVQLESTFLPLFNISYGNQKTDSKYTATRSDRNNFSVSSSLANAQQFSLGIRFLLEK